MRRWIRLVSILAAGALVGVAGAAAAQDVGPADTLAAMGRQFTRCLDETGLDRSSQITIAFMVKRDGGAFGKPRITFSRLVGDDARKKRFLSDVEAAMNHCLPLNITPGLGGAIAGRMFTVTIGGAARGEGR